MARHRKTRRSVYRKRRQTRGRKQRGGIFGELVCRIVNGVRKCFRGSGSDNNNATKHNTEKSSGGLPKGFKTADGYTSHTYEEAKMDSGKKIETRIGYIDSEYYDEHPTNPRVSATLSVRNGRVGIGNIESSDTTENLNNYIMMFDTDISSYIYKVID
jgi:hypothetical protein